MNTNEIHPARHGFYIGENRDDAVAEISFDSKENGPIVITHTYVASSLRGHGLGLALVNKVCEYAREEHKKVIPVCLFARKVMTGNKNYDDIISGF